MVDINAQIDYYAILGVPENVMPDTLKHAYRELVRIYHPDAVSGDAGKFREIQEAYDILSDSVYRRTYNKLRDARGLLKSDKSPVSFEIYQNRKQLPMLADEQVFYIVMDLEAEESYEPSRQNLNIALVIDSSTSMRGSRMLNVKMAATDLLNALREDDYLSIVTFSDRANVVAPASPVGNKHAFQSSIAAISTGGGTEIYQGLLAGLSETARFATDATINHVLLLTDGLTYGDEELAINEVKQAKNHGIGISAFGIGEDWNDVFLDRLARQGGGISQYIESPTDIRMFLNERIQHLSNLVARQMQIQLNVAPYVYVQSVHSAHPHMAPIPISSENVVYLGDIAAAEQMVLVFAVVIQNSEGEMGDRRVLRFDIRAEKPEATKAFSLSRDIHITFTEEPEDESIPSRIFNILSRLSVFQLQEKAWYALEMGERITATHYLQSAATKLFDLGYPELGQATMLEANRISLGDSVSMKGRKQIRYGTRALQMPDS